MGEYTDSSYSYNAATGILTLSDSLYSSLTFRAKSIESAHSEDPNFEVFYVFEVRVEKYRSIDDLRGMTRDRVSHIATMQAIEQNILEYTYQFSHAKNTQQGLSEMCYTVIVTVASTIIATIATLGIGAIAKKMLPSVVAGKGAEAVINVGKFISRATSKSFNQFTKFLSRSSSALSILVSAASEAFQEVFLDPIIETIMTNMVAKAGGDIFAQIFWSSMAEAGRETLTGSMSSFLFGNTQKLINTRHITNDIQSNQVAAQDTISQRESHIQVQPHWSQIIRGGVSILIGTALLGIGGPAFFGASLVSGYMALKGFSKSFTIHKTIIKNIITGQSSKDYLLDNIIADETDAAIAEGLQNAIDRVQGSSIAEVAKEKPSDKIVKQTSKWGRVGRAIGFAGLVVAGLGITGGLASVFGFMGGISGIFATAIMGTTAMVRNINSFRTPDLSFRKSVRKTKPISFILKKGSKDNMIGIYRDRSEILVHITSREEKYTSPIKDINDNINGGDYNAIQPYESRLTIMTHSHHELMKIHSKKSRQYKKRGLFGVVYLIIDWETGKLKVGRTETSLGTRKSQYISAAIRQLDKKDLITERIRELIAIKGKKLVKKTLEWIPIEVVLRTGSSDEHIAHDRKLIENLEQLWQNKLGTSDPRYGYDQTSGAAGPHARKASYPPTDVEITLPRVFINPHELQILLEKACDYNQILSVLSIKKKYLGINSRDIYDNIKYHWPFLARGLDTFRLQNRLPALLKNARYYFIAQIVSNYVENGYDSLSEIALTFQSEENPSGVSRETISRAIKQEFEVNSWAGFLSLHGTKLTPQSIKHLDIREFLNVGGKSLEEHIKFTLSTYIIKGLSEGEIVEEIRTQDFHISSLQGLQRYIYKFWGSLANARKVLVAPILALSFKLGHDSAQIREGIPFFQKRGTGLSAGEVVRAYCKQWFTINPTQARNILRYRSLNEFLNQNLNDQ